CGGRGQHPVLAAARITADRRGSREGATEAGSAHPDYPGLSGFGEGQCDRAESERRPVPDPRTEDRGFWPAAGASADFRGGGLSSRACADPRRTRWPGLSGGWLLTELSTPFVLLGVSLLFELGHGDLLRR